MGFFGDAVDWTKEAYKDTLGQVHGAILNTIAPPPEDARKTSSYGSVDRNNYNMPGYQARQDRLLEAGLGATHRQERVSDFRGDQRSLADMLMRQARGQDSLSAEQLRQATARNVAGQQAFAVSARPGQSAMANRLAMQNVGNLNQQLAGQQSLAGIQERLAASQSLGALLGGARGQDQESYASQQERNDALLTEMLRQEMLNAQAQQQGGMGYESARTSRYGADLGYQQGPSQQEQIMSMARDGLSAYVAGGG